MGSVGVGVEEEVGLEDFDIAAVIREAKSMVCGVCGLWKWRCLVGGWL